MCFLVPVESRGSQKAILSTELHDSQGYPEKPYQGVGGDSLPFYPSWQTVKNKAGL